VDFDIVTSLIVDNSAFVLDLVVNVSRYFFLNNASYYFGVIQYSEEDGTIVQDPDGMINFV